MKIRMLIESTIDVAVVEDGRSHARCGEIITDARIYEPMYVIKSYLEPRMYDHYGEKNEEILYHGTGYVDAVSLDTGQVKRVQYYEYRILTDDEDLRKQFEEIFTLGGEHWPDLFRDCERRLAEFKEQRRQDAANGVVYGTGEYN